MNIFISVFKQIKALITFSQLCNNVFNSADILDC